MTHFSWLCLFFSCLFYRMTLQLPSSLFPPLSFCSPLLHYVFPCLFLLSLCASICFSPSTHMCGKNPALGLHGRFHVRTSGDIKGLQRGLSLCISPYPTVCTQDLRMLSALHSLTARLRRWSVEGKREKKKKTCQHPPAVIVHMYMRLQIC